MDVANKAIIKATPYIQEALRWTHSTLDIFEKWQLVLFTSVACYLIYRVYDFWEYELDKGLFFYVKQKIFSIAKKLPIVRGLIMSEIKKTEKSLKEDILKMNKGKLFIESLPKKGMSEEEVVKLADEYSTLGSGTLWREGAVSGCVYGAVKELENLTTQIYTRFAWTNPLHADVFPDVRKMEAEVVRWVCNLFNGDEDTCGTMSSGGTESIMLACRAYREIAFSKGIRRPEILCPVTAHAAFDKAADFFQMKIVHVPVDPKTKKVRAKQMRKYITQNTCMLVGSAPQFPHGAIDPIEDLSKLAQEFNLPLHVDACLGGFLVVFMRAAGYSMPKFDFSLPGVTSISCDTHKYGYAPKGSSVIVYRNSYYRKHQYFSAVEWPGGIYASPTFAGSRPGSLIAMTWATLAHIGFEGYVKITKEVIDTTRFIANELKNIPEIELMCEADVSVVSFTSSQFNILRLADDMSSRGWQLNAIQNPTGLHIAVTRHHTLPGVAQRLVKDVKECVVDIMSRGDRKLGKTAAMYCSSQAVPDKSVISDVAFIFLDACYSTENDNVSKSVQNGKKHD